MKPTHNPDVDAAPAYTVGDCVWVWDRFYEEWVAGIARQWLSRNKGT